jgi:hypothetical protein
MIYGEVFLGRAFAAILGGLARLKSKFRINFQEDCGEFIFDEF